MRSLFAALLASTALAQPPGATALLVANAGQVTRIEADGTQRTYVTCAVERSYHLIVPPYDEHHETTPCTFGPLVTHETSGRWAVAVVIRAPTFNSRISHVINGRPVKVPAARSGDLLLLGDAGGLVAVSTGVERSWFKENEKMRSQSFRAFSADGERLHLVVVGNVEGKGGPSVSHWQLPFSPSPKVIAAQPWEADRLASQLPGRAGGVLVEGQHVLSYREGGTVMRQYSHTEWSPVCDPAAPGRWTHLDRRTGREATLWTDDWCWTSTSPFVGLQVKNGVAILNKLNLKRTREIARYELATGTLTPLPISGLVETPLALSDDGRHLLARTYEDGLAVFDAQTGGVAFKAEIGPAKGGFVRAGFFSAPPDTRTAQR